MNSCACCQCWNPALGLKLTCRIFVAMLSGWCLPSVMYLGPKHETFSTLFLEMSHYKAHLWAHLSHYYSWLKLKCSFQINFRFSVPPMYGFVPLNHPLVLLWARFVSAIWRLFEQRYAGICRTGSGCFRVVFCVFDESEYSEISPNNALVSGEAMRLLNYDGWLRLWRIWLIPSRHICS